jgi:hypothetical protein
MYVVLRGENVSCPVFRLQMHKMALSFQVCGRHRSNDPTGVSVLSNPNPIIVFVAV